MNRLRNAPSYLHNRRDNRRAVDCGEYGLELSDYDKTSEKVQFLAEECPPSLQVRAGEYGQHPLHAALGWALSLDLVQILVAGGAAGARRLGKVAAPSCNFAKVRVGSVEIRQRPWGRPVPFILLL
jgi:hypothetical protein